MRSYFLILGCSCVLNVGVVMLVFAGCQQAVVSDQDGGENFLEDSGQPESAPDMESTDEVVGSIDSGLEETGIDEHYPVDTKENQWEYGDGVSATC